MTLEERLKELEELLRQPVTPAAEAPEGSSHAIAILKSAIGDCADKVAHKKIRAQLWKAVEIIYRMRGDSQLPLLVAQAKREALDAALKFARHKDRCKGFPASSDEYVAEHCDCGFVELFGKDYIERLAALRAEEARLGGNDVATTR